MREPIAARLARAQWRIKRLTADLDLAAGLAAARAHLLQGARATIAGLQGEIARLQDEAAAGHRERALREAAEAENARLRTELAAARRITIIGRPTDLRVVAPTRPTDLPRLLGAVPRQQGRAAA